MTQLTDTQLVLLSAASQRADGMVPIHERLKGGVAKAVGTKLMALGLAEERIALSAASVWRESEVGDPLALFITAQGLAALGLGDDEAVAAGDAAQASVADRFIATTRQVPVALPEDHSLTAPACTQVALPTPRSEPSNIAPARPGTKKALVIGLLERVDGASVDEIMKLTGWQPHTIRAVLTGLRKSGRPIRMVREAGCATRYRISGPEAEAGDGIDAVGTAATAAHVGAGA